MKRIQEHEVKNQTDAVLWNLQTKGNITSWEAIKEYGATRLSAIIFNLRQRGHYIDSIPQSVTNRWGKHTKIANYTYSDLTFYERGKQSKLF